MVKKQDSELYWICMVCTLVGKGMDDKRGEQWHTIKKKKSRYDSAEKVLTKVRVKVWKVWEDRMHENVNWSYWNLTYETYKSVVGMLTDGEISSEKFHQKNRLWKFDVLHSHPG